MVVSWVRLPFGIVRLLKLLPPKAGKNPPTLVKPQTPMTCKFVGTVKATKIWAGDCVDAAELRGSAPSAEVASPSLPAAAAVPPGQKE